MRAPQPPTPRAHARAHSSKKPRDGAIALARVSRRDPASPALGSPCEHLRIELPASASSDDAGADPARRRVSRGRGQAQRRGEGNLDGGVVHAPATGGGGVRTVSDETPTTEEEEQQAEEDNRPSSSPPSTSRASPRTQQLAQRGSTSASRTVREIKQGVVRVFNTGIFKVTPETVDTRDGISLTFSSSPTP